MGGTTQQRGRKRSTSTSSRKTNVRNASQTPIEVYMKHAKELQDERIRRRTSQLNSEKKKVNKQKVDLKYPIEDEISPAMKKKVNTSSPTQNVPEKITPLSITKEEKSISLHTKTIPSIQGNFSFFTKLRIGILLACSTSCICLSYLLLKNDYEWNLKAAAQRPLININENEGRIGQRPLYVEMVSALTFIVSTPENNYFLASIFFATLCLVFLYIN